MICCLFSLFEKKGNNSWVDNIQNCYDWTLIVKTLPRKDKQNLCEKAAADVYKQLAKNSVFEKDRVPGESRKCYYMRCASTNDEGKLLYEDATTVPGYVQTFEEDGRIFIF